MASDLPEPEPAATDGSEGAPPGSPAGDAGGAARIRAGLRSLGRSASRLRPQSPRGRWIRVALILLLGAVAAGGYIVTRPTVLRGILQPALTRALGGEVTIDDVRLEGFSTLVVRSLLVRAPGWEGDAAEVVRAEDVRVTVSLAALLIGDVEVRSLQFGRLRVRSAERADAPGEFNILALGAEGRSDEDRLHPVRVDLNRLDIETGTVTRDGVWRRTGERSLRGFLAPSPDRRDGTLFSFRLADIVDGASADAPVASELAIAGTWDERTFAIAASLDAITLDDRVLALFPLAVQRTARTLGLSGQIRSATVKWAPKAPIFAELAIADMSMRLPEGIDLDDGWSRFRNGKREPREGLPSIHVRDGTIRLDGANVVLDRLTGELASTLAPSSDATPGSGASAPPDSVPGVVPVPIALTFSLAMDDFPIASVDWNDPDSRAKWIERTLRMAPFKLAFSIRGFDSSQATPGFDPVLEVPTPIAEALETFGVTAWRLDVETEFSRGKPIRDERGEWTAAAIRSHGQCFLSNGRGAYDGFPYQISDVRGHISFDQEESDDPERPGDDRLTIDYVTGTTEAGSTVTMKGMVSHLGPNARAEVAVSAPSFIIDARLIELFERGRLTSIACLFHQPSLDGLDSGGHVPHGDEAELTERLKALRSSLALATEPEQRERLAEEAVRVERMLSVRPFAMGGTGSLNIKLVRDPKADPPVQVTGKVDIERAGVLIDEFPYPLVVTSGRIEIEPGIITFGEEGLRATTLEGGLVRIGGKIEIVPRERLPGTTSADTVRARPDITITAAGDRITPRLFAALPPNKGDHIPGWPGHGMTKIARLLDATGLRGTIDLHGRITEEAPPPGVPIGRRMPIHTRLVIELRDGSIDAKASEGVRPSLPSGLALRDVVASLVIDRDQVELTAFRATDAFGAGTVVGAGRFDPDDQRESVQFRLQGMAISPWIVEAFPDEALGSARAWWERWRPRGTFDAALSLSSADGGNTLTSIEVRPGDMVVQPFGKEVSLRGLDGSLRLVADPSGSHLSVDGLRLADGLDAEAGELSIDAALDSRGAEVAAATLDVAAKDLRLEAGLTELLIRWSGAEEFADALIARHPVGRTDGALHATIGESSPSRAPEWRLSLSPSSVAIDIESGAIRGRPTILFDPESTITVNRDGATLDTIRGSFDGGSLALQARIDTASLPHVAEGTYSLHGAAWSDALAALLPPPLNLGRDSIDLKAQGLDLNDAAIRLVWDPERGITSPESYAVRAAVGLSQAQLSVGVPLTELDGAVDVDFLYARGAAASGGDDIRLRAGVTIPSCRIYDRLLTEGSTEILFAPAEPDRDGVGRRLLLNDIGGRLADGRVVGNATVDLDAKRYAADVRVINASLAPLLAPRDPESASGGAVDGRLSLEGPTGEEDPGKASRRTGRGRISIRDAAMAKSPITLRLLQLSQLALPLSSTLKTADIQFTVDGTTATFDRFELTTSGLVLDGAGTLDTRDFSVDLGLRSRGRLGILSDIVGTLSDQLYEIRVTGPLSDPQASVRMLPSMRRGDEATVNGEATGK